MYDEEEDVEDGGNGENEKKLGTISVNDSDGNGDGDGDIFFVRRLKHLQHIRMKVEGEIKDRSKTVVNNHTLVPCGFSMDDM